MTAFKNNPSEWQRLDFRILQNGWTSLYWKMEILEKDLSWFAAEQYSITDFNCRNWRNESQMHQEIKDGLLFPDYYGGNCAALNDCLSDLEIPEPGQIIVFRHFDSLEHKRAHILLDTFATNARRQMLFGKRLILLTQVSDPDYQMEPIGGTPVTWNPAEWMDADRKK